MTVSDTFKRDLRRFKKLDSDRKFLVAVLIVVVFLASVVLGGFFLNRGLPSQESKVGERAPQPTSKPTTTLALSPSEDALTAGAVTTVSVMLTGLPVTAADVVIKYDPKVVTVANVVNGEVFQRVIRNKLKDGQISYSASVSPDEPGAVTTGTVLSFNATPLSVAKDSSIKISFDPIETITALNGENTLGTTVSGVYEVR